jgi:membrane dipeptidase
MRLRTVIAATGLTAVALAQTPAAVHPVIDLHVDLAYALRAGRHTIDSPGSPVRPSRLLRGGVQTLVLPLFVAKADVMRSEDVLSAYRETFLSFDRARRSAGNRGVLLAPGEPPRPGHVATLLALEGAEGFADRPESIGPWVRRGVCFVGLVHAHTNTLAGSSTDPSPEGRMHGLSDMGRALADRVYQSGGVVDAAHASDTAIDDLVVLAKRMSAPLVISHTGVRALTAIDRNVDDEHLKAIASTGGVVGIDLHSGHIARDGRARATLDDLVAHIEHAIAVAGARHVALGSDLDGGIMPPSGADGAEVWPLVAARLAARGVEVEAVLHDNAARVIEWARAHGCASEPASF